VTVSSETNAKLQTALAHHAAGRYGDAAQLCQQILQENPETPQALHLLGGIAYLLGQTDRALPLFKAALALTPTDSAILNDLGLALRKLGRLPEALDALQKALSIGPRTALLEGNIGAVLKDLKRPADALRHYDAALALNPTYAAAHNNRGNALQNLGRLQDSLASYIAAIRLAPSYAAAWGNLADTIRSMGRPKDALPFYKRALELDPNLPDVGFNMQMARLLLGQFPDAWNGYEDRHNRLQPKDRQPHPDTTLWDGTPAPDKRLLLYVEQGLGDTLQFCRLITTIRPRVGWIGLEAQADLIPLLKDLPGLDYIYPKGETPPAFDLHCPLLSLPQRLRLTLDQIPNQAPYLTPPPAPQKKWAERISNLPGLKVGLVWAGNPLHGNDAVRSAPFDVLTPLLDIPGIHFFSLQKGASLAQLDPTGRVTDLGPDLTDFGETAAAITALDLVIAVDTSVAHLTGALGKPLFLMLPVAVEWRWMLVREDCPWYPTARLFRQSNFGDWHGVVTQIGEALQKLAAGDTSPYTPTKWSLPPATEAASAAPLPLEILRLLEN
jgi:tetratricopeptide (TPR) repeat protein